MHIHIHTYIDTCIYKCTHTCTHISTQLRKILAIRLRINKNIKGIDVNDSQILLSQYADDTSLVLDGTKGSLKSL